MKWLANGFLLFVMLPLLIVALPFILALLLLRGLAVGFLMFHDVLLGMSHEELRKKWKIS